MITTKSGFHTLMEIDQSLQGARQSLHSLADQINKGGENALLFRQQESQAYRELAQIRLDHLQSKTLTEQLQYSEKQALDLLEQRQTYLTELINKINQAEQVLSDSEKNRQNQAQNLTEKVENLEQLLAKIHQQLALQADYQQQQSKTQKAVVQASFANEKRQQAAAEESNKGKPYRLDQLFMYLWHLKFGTNAYQVTGKTRYLDQWLAHFIGYEALRQNYAMLQEIPKRLKAHADDLTEKANQQLKILKELQQIAEKKEAVPEQEALITKEQQALEKIDQMITKQESDYNLLVAERSLTLSGQDPYFKQALEALVTTFRDKAIFQLRQEAAETPAWQDDQIVENLLELREEKKVIEENLQHYQKLHSNQLERVKGLESIRLKFKQNHYDQTNSRFSEGAMTSVLLQEFLRGAVNTADLWQSIQRNQRFEQRRQRVQYSHNRGGGGFNLPRDIHIPSGFGGNSGGFSTGGGF